MDLIDEFSDGRIQFAYVKVKDSNTGLPKSALIAWCGEGVPERTKGYFTSHLNTVSRLLHVRYRLPVGGRILRLDRATTFRSPLAPTATSHRRALCRKSPTHPDPSTRAAEGPPLLQQRPGLQLLLSRHLHLHKAAEGLALSILQLGREQGHKA